MKALEISVHDTISVSEIPFVLSLLIFDLEAVESLQEYAETLKSIRKRLENEGYEFRDGRIYKPTGIINQTQ